MTKTNTNPVITDNNPLELNKYGQMKHALARYSISRSTFTRLRDNDPEFPTWFKRGRLGLYDFAKLDNYFSA